MATETRDFTVYYVVKALISTTVKAASLEEALKDNPNGRVFAKAYDYVDGSVTPSGAHDQTLEELD